MPEKQLRCSICKHEQVSEINRALGEKDSFREISERFRDITTSSIHRHRSKCLKLGTNRQTPNTDSLQGFPSNIDTEALSHIESWEELEKASREAARTARTPKAILDALQFRMKILEAKERRNSRDDAEKQVKAKALEVLSRVPEWFLRELAAQNPEALERLNAAVEKGTEESPSGTE